MKSILLGPIAVLLAMSGPAAVAQEQRRPSSNVVVSIVRAEHQTIELGALPKVDQQRLISLRNALEPWAQSQRVKVTVSCTYPPLKCTITVEF